MKSPLKGALDRLGQQDLVDTLTNAKASDLTALLLEVMRRRALAQRPRDLLQAHERRFCRVSDLDPRLFNRIDALLLRAASEGQFDVLELSPVAPLGSCSAVAPCDPKKIVAATRQLEVVSDPSNVLALEAALRRQRGAPRVDLAASHRALRAQTVPADHPDFRAHFRLFVLVSVFPTRGSGRAETEALLHHLAVYRRLTELGASLLRLSVSCKGQPWVSVAARCRTALEELGYASDDDDDRIGSNNYYQGLSFKGLVRTPAGRELPLIDGGFTDWGAQLMSRSTERTLVSAIGTEPLARDLGRDF